MKQLSSGKIGIAEGSTVMFSDFADGGAMWTGQGDRESRHGIGFSEPFRERPSVMVGNSMWDIVHRHTLRADTAAEKVSKTGFDLVFRTWGDTRDTRVRAAWTAIGPLRDDED